MASYTTNLNLKKPAGSENVAIGDINGNMDAIDTAYGNLNTNKEPTWVRLEVPANGTATFNMGTTSSPYGIAFIVTSGYSASKHGAYILSRASSSLNKTDIKTASDVSFSLTASTNTVTISNNGSGSVYANVKAVTAGVSF